MSRRVRTRPQLVVHEARLVPITPEQEERATAVLKALLVGYLRQLRAEGWKPLQFFSLLGGETRSFAGLHFGLLHPGAK